MEEMPEPDKRVPEWWENGMLAPLMGGLIVLGLSFWFYWWMGGLFLSLLDWFAWL